MCDVLLTLASLYGVIFVLYAYSVSWLFWLGCE